MYMYMYIYIYIWLRGVLGRAVFRTFCDTCACVMLLRRVCICQHGGVNVCIIL